MGESGTVVGVRFVPFWIRDLKIGTAKFFGAKILPASDCAP